MSTEGSARRAAELIHGLSLEPHPEGGFYREMHRSALRVTAGSPERQRSALTVIYFLLRKGDVSRWHRVRSADEVWTFVEGDPLQVVLLDPRMEEAHPTLLTFGRPLLVVPAGWWQSARPTGTFSLVLCTVGPGFEFEDFDLARDLPTDAATIRRRFEEYAGLI